MHNSPTPHLTDKMTDTRDAQYSRSQMRPHIYGANPHQYRRGTAVSGYYGYTTSVVSGALDTVYPYILKEYVMDVGRWQAATRTRPQAVVGGAQCLLLVPVL